jgi:tRNA modification GTPase
MTDGRTTVTRLTSSAPAAIAVIEIQGPKAIELVQHYWSPIQGKPELQVNRIRYGMFRSERNDRAAIGESIVVVQRGPEACELHCHGGQAAALTVLRTLVNAGAQERQRSEWIAHHASTQIAAEATEDLLRASTVRTASILMDQVRGALDEALDQIENHAKEGRLAEARRIADGIWRWSDVGLHLIHPWRVVLCGPPNVGKSSLLNRLLGYSRAVVHAEAGTTRDLLAESTSIEGWPVTLIDSAGVRESEHEVESLGIERARRAIDTADRLLLLIDPDAGWTDEHQAIWQAHSSKCLLVRTKSDRDDSSSPPSNIPSIAYLVSAVSGAGIEQLMKAISLSLVPDHPLPRTAVPFRSWHVEKLSRLHAGNE